MTIKLSLNVEAIITSKTNYTERERWKEGKGRERDTYSY